MGNMVSLKAPYIITFEEYAERPLGEREVRIEMLYSGISAGTQLTLYRGKNPYIDKKFNSQYRVFDVPKEESSPFPIPGAWAYEEAGRISELGSGVTAVREGDIVYGTWGHRTTAIVGEDYAKAHILPPELDPVIGIYSQMGCIALGAVLDADIHIGETVAVFGQGVPGQIVTQLAKQSGARVIAVDLDDYRLAFSKKMGADITINSSHTDAGREIKELTHGGADKVIEISGAGPALNAAIRACAYQGKVVVSGFITGEAKGLFLGEEFHHNRIQLICSQIENVALHLSATWNRERMEKTIFALCKEGKLDLASLITHTERYEDAAKVYEMLDHTTSCLQVVLKF